MPDSNDVTGAWGVLKSISEGLRVEPAYLLVFAIAVVFMFFSVGTGTDGVVTHDLALSALGFGGLLASLATSAFVIYRIEDHRPAPPIIDEPPVPPRPTGNQRFDQILSGIQNDIKDALGYVNPVFADAIYDECAEFQATTAKWRDGSIEAQGKYDQLLLRFYETAKDSVFSTSIPEYLSTWSTPFGAAILRAHEKGSATVTRVFMFKNRTEVTPEAIDVMSRQFDQGIRVFVHFTDQSIYDFPPDISRDFTVIDDGEAIGITISFRKDDLAAKWFIRDTSRKPQFSKLADRLKQQSEGYAKFAAGIRAAAGSTNPLMHD